MKKHWIVLVSLLVTVQAYGMDCIDLARPELMSLDTLFFVATQYAQSEETQLQAFWSEKFVEYLGSHNTGQNFNKVASWCELAADPQDGYISKISRQGAAYVALQIYHGLSQIGAIEDSLELFRKQGMLAERALLPEGIPADFIDSNTGFLTPAYLFQIDQESKELAILKKISELFFKFAVQCKPGSAIGS